VKEEFQIGKNLLIITDQKVQLIDGILNKSLINPSQFRFGIRPIELDPFTIGTKFQIDLMDKLDRSLSIEIISYLKIRENRKLKLYEQILDLLWENFFLRKLSNYQEALNDGEIVSLGNFQLCKEWIKKVRKDPKKDTLIEIEDALILRHWAKLIIKSKFDATKNISIDTLKEWNAPFIYALLDNLKGEK